eukprot:6867632-Pyramimonas_sp.AAC.1
MDLRGDVGAAHGVQGPTHQCLQRREARHVGQERGGGAGVYGGVEIERLPLVRFVHEAPAERCAEEAPRNALCVNSLLPPVIGGQARELCEDRLSHLFVHQ